MTRKLPNILITGTSEPSSHKYDQGTPGTGKTTTAELLSSSVQEMNFTQISIGEIVKEKGFYHEFDEEFQSYIIDEDKLIDELEEEMELGGRIVDHHGCDLFPERYLHLINGTAHRLEYITCMNMVQPVLVSNLNTFMNIQYIYEYPIHL